MGVLPDAFTCTHAMTDIVKLNLNTMSVAVFQEKGNVGGKNQGANAQVWRACSLSAGPWRSAMT